MIVAITGHVEPKFIEKAWHHDFDEFVAKPVKEDLLMNIIDGNLAEADREGGIAMEKILENNWYSGAVVHFKNLATGSIPA